MKKNILSKEIEEKIKRPFTFVSYCQKDNKIYNKVKELVDFLTEKGFNIIYDRGGLEPGEELSHFMNLILHDNCKFVIVVCDKFYIEKAKNNDGGVGSEYFIIENDYQYNKSKYIPIQNDGNILPIFNGKVYISFSESVKNIYYKLNSRVDFNICRFNSSENESDRKKQFNGIMKDVYNLYNEEEYRTALDKINIAEDIYNSITKKNKSKGAMLYNYKLILLIKFKENDKYKNAIVNLLNLINGLPIEIQAVYYLNCAIASGQINEYEKEVEYATKAYGYAHKAGFDDAYDYSLTLATAYLNERQYKKAVVYGERALNEYCSYSSYEDKKTYIKILSNCSEYQLNYCNEVLKRKDEKLKSLLKAEKNINEAINVSKELINLEDSFFKELYKIATMVYGALKDYYGSITDS